MKKVYIAAILFIIVSLFISINSLEQCLPDGCSFSTQLQTCQDGNCVNEDVGSHLNERSVFLSAVVNDNENLLNLLPLFLFFFIWCYYKPQFFGINFKFKLIIKNYAFVHNRLIGLFSKGLLHPKIY